MTKQIAVNVQILDTRTRKSWALILIDCPDLNIYIKDWFHLCTFDQEHVAVGYAFTIKSAGLATAEELAGILCNLGDLVIEHYFFKNQAGFIIDRFKELDTTSNYTS
jgi:hypothetical protein